MTLNMHQKKKKIGVGQQEIQGTVLQHLPAAFCKLLEQCLAPKEIIQVFFLLLHTRDGAGSVLGSGVSSEGHSFVHLSCGGTLGVGKHSRSLGE